MLSCPSNPDVTALLRKITLALSVAATFCAVPAQASPQESSASPDSVEHVRAVLGRTPLQSLKFDARMPRPVATYKVSVDQRVFGLPIVEQLRKEFELTTLQRQSADWRAKCCGINLLSVADGIEKAARQWRESRIRNRVSRELADVIAAADKRSAANVRHDEEEDVASADDVCPSVRMNHLLDGFRISREHSLQDDDRVDGVGRTVVRTGPEDPARNGFVTAGRRGTIQIHAIA